MESVVSIKFLFVRRRLSSSRLYRIGCKVTNNYLTLQELPLPIFLSPLYFFIPTDWACPTDDFTAIILTLHFSLKEESSLAFGSLAIFKINHG